MDQISTLFQSTIFRLLATLVIGACLIAFFWWRAGSIHTLLERIWHLIAGKSEVHDPVLKEFIQENRELERFRFIYGLKVSSMADVHRLSAWMKAHAITLDQVRQIKRWFQPTEGYVIAPPKNYILWRGVFCLFFYVLFCASMFMSSSSTALLQVRASKT